MKLFLKTLPLKIILIISCFLSGSYQLSAQKMPVDSVIYYPTSEVRYIVKQDAAARNLWWWGWLSGYSAATIGQGIAGISSDKLSGRQDMFLGAATTLIGALGQLFTPVQPVANRDLNSLLLSESMTNSSRSNECLEYLKKMAIAESMGRGWQMHLESGAVNLGSGLITWLGFKRTLKAGLLNFAFNTAVTEAQIWSQPVRAKRYYSRIIRQGITSETTFTPEKDRCTLSVSSSASGIRLALTF